MAGMRGTQCAVIVLMIPGFLHLVGATQTLGKVGSFFVFNPSIKIKFFTYLKAIVTVMKIIFQ